MRRERFARIKEAALRACELAGAARSAFLEDLGREDPALRAEVESLLVHDATPAPIVETGAIGKGLGARLAQSLGATPESAMPERVGPYALLRVLGEGGMGTVYRAEQREPHSRVVALKVIRRGIASDRAVARFELERQSLSMMSHPGIARVFDAGADEDGRLYFAMELVEGEPVTDYCDHRRLTVHERLALFLQVCDAVQYAHRRGIIHRDLKPSNILISDLGGTAAVKVIDFGIAKAVHDPSVAGPRLTQEGHFVGTPAYMSPEQASGSTALVDARSDVYALGVVLYELLAGKPPYDLEGLTPFDTLRVVRETEPEPPSRAYGGAQGGPMPVAVAEETSHERDQVCRARGGTRDMLRLQLEGALDCIVLTALRKVQEERYGAVVDLAEDIQCHLRGLPIRATRPQQGHGGPAAPHNLPSALTSFVGRSIELAECRRLLGDVRLLTLTGVGGCGKTRLALRLAEGALRAFPDGVWFVDLAPLPDGTRVPFALAAVLDLQEEPERPILHTLARHVSEKRALIVLDNCEHVLDACRALAGSLLAAGPALKFLATSREYLDLEGEAVYAVPPLSLPAEGGVKESLSVVEAADAVILFCDRARLVEPGFRLTEEDAPVVAEICRRLDGIPLALELAAALAKVLAPEQIRSKLRERFRLLTGGSKTAPSRHQTLRAALQWSYEQLEEEEGRLLRIVSVFAGGWTLESAAAVAGSADEIALLGPLARLVDKSLIVVEASRDRERRYRLLETVRAFAEEELDRSGAADDAGARHTEYFLGLVEKADRKLLGSEQDEWYARLGREHENVLAALDRCRDSKDGAGTALRIVGALRNFWWDLGYVRLGLERAGEALNRPGSEARTAARALALYGAGGLAVRHGSLAQAKSLLEESVGIARSLGDRLLLTKALSYLGVVEANQGDHARARNHHTESVAIARELGDKLEVAGSLHNLADLYRAEGDLNGAAPFYEESLELTREFGDWRDVANTLANLALVAVGRGDLVKARTRLIECIEVAERGQEVPIRAVALDAAACLAASVGDSQRAARTFAAATAAWERIGASREPLDERHHAPIISRVREALGPSGYDAAWGAGRALSMEGAIAETLHWLRVCEFGAQ